MTGGAPLEGWVVIMWVVIIVVFLGAALLARIIFMRFAKQRGYEEKKWSDNFFRAGIFDNTQKNALDGSSNLAYNIFFRFYFTTSFIVAGMWVIIALFLLYFYVGRRGEINPYLIDLFINPLNIIVVIFIVSTICIYTPMQKVGTIQDQNLIRKKFSLKTFLSIILVWFILFSGFSLVFDVMSSHPNPTGGCDICGNSVQFKYTENNVIIHRYCFIHAVDKAFLDPTSLINPLINRETSTFIFKTSFGDLGFFELVGVMDVYIWLFVIGFAFILGKGYTWK
jgi:hypothetical protein